MRLMSNHTLKMTKFTIEINGNVHFSPNWHGEIFLKIDIMLQMLQSLLPQIKIFE